MIEEIIVGLLSSFIVGFLIYYSIKLMPLQKTPKKDYSLELLKAKIEVEKELAPLKQSQEDSRVYSSYWKYRHLYEYKRYIDTEFNFIKNYKQIIKSTKHLEYKWSKELQDKYDLFAHRIAVIDGGRKPFLSIEDFFILENDILAKGICTNIGIWTWSSGVYTLYDEATAKYKDNMLDKLREKWDKEHNWNLK